MRPSHKDCVGFVPKSTQTQSKRYLRNPGLKTQPVTRLAAGERYRDKNCLIDRNRRSAPLAAAALPPVQQLTPAYADAFRRNTSRAPSFFRLLTSLTAGRWNLTGCRAGSMRSGRAARRPWG